MPTPTYLPIATYTLPSTTTSITFNSIPQTYRDLVIISNSQNATGSSMGFRIRVNGDTGSNYVAMTLFGGSSPATAFSGTADHAYVNATGTGANRFSNFQFDILDYSATDKHKNLLKLSHYFGAIPFVESSNFRWTNTAAITSFTIYTSIASAFNVGSTVSIYGIAG